MMPVQRPHRWLAPVALMAVAILTLPGLAWSEAQPIVDRVVDLDAPRPDDTREMRTFVLDNGLEVLLVSDPKFQKSAVALDVNIGRHEDPGDDEGMAHFLEHLLFLGTEKYPDVDGFEQYMSANQGSNNAYTGDEHMNFQLEIPDEAFEGALDRFSQFFVAPLFNPEYVERERNAVHSEHEKNIQQDGWRVARVQGHLLKEGHPARQFGTGNLETLEGIDRDRMITFYEKYFSANIMKLCMLSSYSLDRQEQWAREMFSAVPNHDRERLVYSSEVFESGDLPMFLQIRPVAEVRTLELEFPTPPFTRYYKAKPNRLISSLIGHEAEGSLLSQLKAENLATGLNAGGYSNSYVGWMSFNISLTEEGRQNIDRVLELFYSYVNMLREKGLEERFFTEETTMADLNFYYRDHQEGMWTAASLASGMHDYPPLEIERNRWIYFEHDLDAFNEFLDLLRPANMRATLLAPDVETDQVEYYYGAEYQVAAFPPDQATGWDAAPVSEAFHYPDRNPFIPDDLALLGNDPHEEPYTLIDDERGVFWFEQDKRFKLPKGRVSVLLLSEVPQASPRNRLLNTLYVRSLNESLNEWRYPVLEAGLAATVSDESRGVRLRFNGYSQRIPDLMVDFAGRLKTIDISEEKFAALKDDLRREYANFDFNQAYSQTFYEYNYLMSPVSIHLKEYRDMVDSITLDEVKAYAGTVLATTAIEGSAYGNLEPATLTNALDRMLTKVDGQFLSAEARERPRTLKLPEGNQFARVFATRTDNNCWLKMVQFGERDYELEAILRVGAAYFESRFYTELRTRQQLGYIVFSGPLLDTEGQGMFFLVQSGTYPGNEIASRAEPWLADAVAGMSEMDPDEFATIQAAVIAELEEKETNMTERLSTMAYQALELDGDFHHKEKVKGAVEELTSAQVTSAFTVAFDPERMASLAVYLDAEGLQPSTPDAQLIEDEAAFKTGYPTF